MKPIRHPSKMYIDRTETLIDHLKKGQANLNMRVEKILELAKNLSNNCVEVDELIRDLNHQLCMRGITRLDH